MANLPLRGLGSTGVVPDVSPYDLPPSGYSRADNVLFEDGKVKRGYVLRTFHNFNTEYTCTASVSHQDATGLDNFFICNLGYDCLRWNNDQFVSVNNSTYHTVTTPAAPETPMNGAVLGSVVYFNKAGSVPIYKLSSDTFFRELYPKAGSPAGVTSTWGDGGTTWTCATLRPFGDYMIAMNMTEGAGAFPSRVRFSDPVTSGQPALNWDASDTTNSAGFVDLAQLEGGIVDGLSLRNQFIIYSHHEAWLMELVGGQFIFNFRRLFADEGVLGINCVAEVGDYHYVFGRDDIYRHNGTQKESISDGRVRDFIFNNMAGNFKHASFVFHDPRFSKILFCYKSVDSNTAWSESTHCNKAAVYDYVNNTWSFMDLPNVVSAASFVSTSNLTYETVAGLSYENVGGTYDATITGKQDGTVFFNSLTHIETPADANAYPAASADVYYDRTHNSALALDTILSASSVISPLETKMNALPILERTGIDLDEAGLETRRYKSLSALYPQMISSTNSTVNFSVGAADLPNNAPNYTTTYPFNPDTEYHLNTRASGRYLSYKLETSNVSTDFELTGIDAEFLTTGKR